MCLSSACGLKPRHYHHSDKRRLPRSVIEERQPAPGSPSMGPWCLAADPAPGCCGLEPSGVRDWTGAAIHPPGAALGPRNNGKVRTTPANNGQPTARSVPIPKRSPRSPDHPDCLSHGGSQGFKSPHLHPTTALVTGLAGPFRRAGAVPDPSAGQQTGSNRERKRPPMLDRGHDDVVKRNRIPDLPITRQMLAVEPRRLQTDPACSRWMPRRSRRLQVERPGRVVRFARLIHRPGRVVADLRSAPPAATSRCRAHHHMRWPMGAPPAGGVLHVDRGIGRRIR